MFLHRSTLLAAAIAVSTVAAGHDKSYDAACSSAIGSAYPSWTDAPTPDSSLSSFLAQQTQFWTYTDPCVVPAVTGSLADDYTSWVSKVQSWQSAHESDYSSVWDVCSGYDDDWSGWSGGGFRGGGFRGGFGGDWTSVCSTITWESAGATGTAGSSGATGTAASDQAATASDSSNAAPRETGLGVIAAAAAAAVGLVVVGFL